MDLVGRKKEAVCSELQLMSTRTPEGLAYALDGQVSPHPGCPSGDWEKIERVCIKEPGWGEKSEGEEMQKAEFRLFSCPLLILITWYFSCGIVIISCCWLSTSNGPGAELSPLHGLLCWITTSVLWSKHYYCVSFTEKQDIQVQRGSVNVQVHIAV